MPLSFAAPEFLWALLALPLVVLLHFVRSRRRRTEVSALFLWRRARQVAERRRRIAPTWLLLAQLLFAALAALALARPQLAAAVAPDRIVIVDASASMAARDPDGVRLDKARAVADRLVGGAGRVALVRAGLDARVIVALTTDRAAVRRAIARLTAGDRSADLQRAVSVAEAIDPAARIDVITDQPPVVGPRVSTFDVAGAGVNVGISAFDLGIQEAYVGVVSNSRRPVQVPVALTRDGAAVASGTVLVPVGGVGSITFPLADVKGTYRAAISPPEGDALALDDVAYAGARQLTAVVEQADSAVLKALDAVPGVTVRVNPRAAEIPADLRVLTGAGDPGALAPGAYLLFAPAAAKPDYRVVTAYDRASPLMRFVDLQDVVVGLDPARPAWTSGDGWQVLASTADLQPVLRYRDAEGVRVLQAAFNPGQTDLVLRAGFPALIANLVREVRAAPAVPMGGALPPGTTFDGASQSYALRPGAYRTPNGGSILVSLDSETQSRLPGPTAASAGQPAATGAAAAAAPAAARTAVRAVPGTPLAALLLVLAVAALVAEWLMWSGVKWPRRGEPRAWRRR